MITSGVIRIILVIDIVAMALLALLYLRNRRLSLAAWCCWGMLALLVPVLGPFLVIVRRPGVWNPDPFPSVHLRQRVHQLVHKVVREYQYQRLRRTFRRSLKR